MNLLAYFKGAISNVHSPGEKPDIFIFATPRSGSTFLLEIISAQRGAKLFDEPISANHPVKRRELGIETWAELTVMRNRKERLKRYFDRLRQNKIKELNPAFYRSHSRFLTHRNVFKVIHGGKDMIPWFASTFAAMIVILIRHPISTALSHKQLPCLPYRLLQPYTRALFSHREIAFAEEIMERGTFFEKAVLDWTLQMAEIFRHPIDSVAAIISYEDLTAFPRESYAYLAEKLWLDPVDHIEALFANPSSTTNQSDEETRRFFAKAEETTDRSYLISKWTERVTPAQTARAFEICEAFALRLYEPSNLFPNADYRLPTLARTPQISGP